MASVGSYPTSFSPAAPPQPEEEPESDGYVMPNEDESLAAIVVIRPSYSIISPTCAKPVDSSIVFGPSCPEFSPVKETSHED
jgi:hypothetical protein